MCRTTRGPGSAEGVHERQVLFDLLLGHAVDVGKAVDVLCLDFSKAFDTVSHSMHQKKMAGYGLDSCAVHWLETYLDS